MENNKVFKSSAVLSGILAIVAAISARADTATCPQKIILKGAAFINHELFPTNQQLRTNFDQTPLYSPGKETYHAWQESDLSAAEQLVRALSNNYKSGQIVLFPQSTSQGCMGTMDNLEFAVYQNGVGFNLTFRDSVFIPNENGAPVQFEIGFPSNCSNCSWTTELFEFQEVTTE